MQNAPNRNPAPLFSPFFSGKTEKKGPSKTTGSCKFAATSQSRLRRASIPTPFVPLGHFPLIGGIGPWKGSREVVTDLHENPNRKFSLRFGKEETSTEDKKPCLQGFVPSWSFLTRLRRPLLFRLAGKDRGEKGRLDAFSAVCV